MKNNIRLVENNSEIDLSFALPTSSLTESELSRIYGGNVEEDCSCKGGGTFRCRCHNGASLVG